MKIKFCGVRGSYSVPGISTNKYGGNTTCVTIYNEFKYNLRTEEGVKEFTGIDRIIIDAGTGIIPLGKEILSNYFAKKENLKITMIFTHLHPDHTQGFPFFAPNYFPGCTIDLYGMEALKKNVGQVLNQTMLPPTFPIEYKDLKSTRVHHRLSDGSKLTSSQGTMEIEVMQAYAPSHPQQGALYYKITDISALSNRTDSSQSMKKGKSIACIWDNESKKGGDMAVIKFTKDCDVMIHDTQYTEEEYMSDKMVVQGFGHSTYDMAIENAEKALIKEKLFCTHFNPAHDDAKLDEIQNNCNTKNKGFEIILAQENVEIEI